jgi:hypothetical protein
MAVGRRGSLLRVVLSRGARARGGDRALLGEDAVAVSPSLEEAIILLTRDSKP